MNSARMTGPKTPSPDGDRLRVAVIDPGYEDYTVEREVLARIGAALDVFNGARHDREGRLRFARGAAGVMVRWTVIDGPFLDALPGLRAIVRYGVGYENVDLRAAAARGIHVANVQGYASDSVSDHALALILACTRDLFPGVATFHSNYNAPPRDAMPELHEMTLGIVGLGRIGGRLARKARSLFREVLACDPYVAAGRFEETGARPCPLGELLRVSDAVSLHCNLTGETTGLIGEAELALLKPTAILVNTARGPVCDEEALARALRQGQFLAAGLDVYGEEPPGDRYRSLLDSPRVVATGHYAWYSSRAAVELQRRAARNMADLLTGQIPEDCLTRNPGPPA